MTDYEQMLATCKQLGPDFSARKERGAIYILVHDVDVTRCVRYIFDSDEKFIQIKFWSEQV